MQKCTVTTLQRGPTWKYKFYVKNQKCVDDDILQETVHPRHLNLSVKFSRTTAFFLITIYIKKDDYVNNLFVKLFVTCDGSDQLFICPDVGDKWVAVNTELKFNTNSGVIHEASNEYLHPYSFEVHLTIQDMPIMPVATMVTSQLFQDKDFTDFQLQGRDGTLRVHKAVLLTHSEMFKSMFLKHSAEKEGSLAMDVTVRALLALKVYMYLGLLPNKGLQQLLLIARTYAMDQLKADCIEKMVRTVTTREDFDNLVKFACDNNVPELIKAMLCS